MKKIVFLLASYAVLSIVFIVVAMQAEQNRSEYYQASESGYYTEEQSVVSVNEYTDGGEFSTPNATYEIRLNTTEDVALGKNPTTFYQGYGTYNGNDVKIYKSDSSSSAMIEYDDGSTLSVDKIEVYSGDIRHISYNDDYNKTFCRIVVDENLNQVDMVDVEECMNLISMEDAKYLYDEMIYVVENYEYE